MKGWSEDGSGGSEGSDLGRLVSRGRITPHKGRAAFRLNSLKHGLSAETIVVLRRCRAEHLANSAKQTQSQPKAAPKSLKSRSPPAPANALSACGNPA